VIALVRVDNRLVHGQILEAWMPRLRATKLVVADDDAARSPLARAAMTLAIPPDVPVTIQPLAEVDWAGLASAERSVLVLVRDVADLERAVALGLTPQRGPRLNLGNVHFASGRSPITPSVFLSAAEVQAVLSLRSAGFEVEARAVPAESPVGVDEIERRYKQAAQR
jgi:PTS system mannose-specific IIB component